MNIGTGDRVHFNSSRSGHPLNGMYGTVIPSRGVATGCRRIRFDNGTEAIIPVTELTAL